MNRIVRTTSRTLRIVSNISMLDVSEFIRPEIIDRLNKSQKDELKSEKTYYTEISQTQFDECTKLCMGYEVN